MVGKKRGISPVIATMLLILLTVSVAGIVASLVVYFVRTQLVNSSECVPYREYFSIDDSWQYTCIATSTSLNYYGVTVKANNGNINSNASVAGVAFLFEEGSISRAVKGINGNTSSDIWMLNQKNNPLIIPARGDIITYVFTTNTDEKFSKVAVSPILASGKVCDFKIEPVLLPTCTPKIAEELKN